MKNSQGGLSRIIKSIDGLCVGKVVQCIKVDGEHSAYGIMWLVSSREALVSEYGAVGHRMHVPDDWMIPIKPGDLDLTTAKGTCLTVD